MARKRMPPKNDTLYPLAIQPQENIPWHRDADQPHCSQVFCISAFGTLRSLQHRHRVVCEFLRQVLPWIPAPDEDLEWNIYPEFRDRSILNEHGTPNPTSIDAFLVSGRYVICVEGKFYKDAEHGFGACTKAKTGKKSECHAYYGPGSNAKTRDDHSWCPLENWDKRRSPRLYWCLGKAFFRPELFRQQAPGDTCPFAGPNYQLMRNFLFSAAYADKYGKAEFGVVVVCPERTSKRICEQMEDFRSRVLLPEFHSRLQFRTYEDYTAALAANNDPEAQHLAGFLSERIDTLIAKIV